MGCGRTDSGVHASKYYAHFDFDIEDKEDLIQKLNYALPSRIAIHDIIKVHNNAHARFDATEREYTYQIHFYKDVFLERFSAYYKIGNLDTHSMLKACELIKKTKDFRAFCKTPQRLNLTLCDIASTSLQYSDGEKRLVFKIRANRFIKSMVRIIVYELIEVGLKRKSLNQFEELCSGIRREDDIVKLAYPQGLILSNVSYPYIDAKANKYLPIP
jgi:tRNA pseudouridine38-40 synthase